ncbi:FecCD family ABC transporter permease [Halalkalibacillus halophilus]|uniref:FecCD family ABC transporter permease n=1 Tax=Halalkalibacillus halophilus TaxID=392827 RepID=UPI0003FC5255|nr:iron ABC transporter permease [Halalkalibacillus halophilus]
MITKQTIRKQRLWIIGLTLAIILTMAIGIGIGYSSISYQRIIPTLLGQGDFRESFILFDIRLPRMIITLLAGMALALSGAILQSLTRNDLADPGIIGINSGAGVAIAVFFLYIPLSPGNFTYVIPVVAFLGAALTAALIYFFSYKRGSGLQPIRLILTGVGFSMALSGAMVILISSAEREKVDFIARWIAGNVWGTDWPFILAILPWLIVLIPFALFQANRLNLLAFSEQVATGVGMRIEKDRVLLLLTAVGLAASAVSVTGGIAFVGLMAPHIAKTLIGKRHQLFIPIALLIGGWLLLFADLVGRNLVDPDGIPAGIMVALIGAPYFLYLLVKKL